MRTALIHPGALGDLVLALPAAQTLSSAGGRVELFAAGGRGELFVGRSVVAAAHRFDQSAVACLFAPDFDPADCRQAAAVFAGFDRVIHACGPVFSANLASLLGPRARVESIDVSPAAIAVAGLHASEFLHRQLFPDAPCPPPRMVATPADLAAAELLLSLPFNPKSKIQNPKFCLLHPGSGGRAGGKRLFQNSPCSLVKGEKTGHLPSYETAFKCWALDGFIEVARRVRAGGWAVAFLLGPVEAEQMTAPNRKRLASEFAVLDELTFSELVGVIASADAYVGNDAGPTHLAAALGVATTVALFGPTDPGVWRPRGQAVRVIRGDPAAGPAWAIAPADVAKAVLERRRASQATRLNGTSRTKTVV